MTHPLFVVFTGLIDTEDSGGRVTEELLRGLQQTRIITVLASALLCAKGGLEFVGGMLLVVELELLGGLVGIAGCCRRFQ